MNRILLWPWAFIKWLGRVLLWLVFLPVGIWRSIRHSRKKAVAEAVKAARREGI
jgi:hypothetical protein